MAKIVLAPEAPDDLNSVSLANTVVSEFPFETDDREVLGNATSHPFLNVEYDAAESEIRYRETGVDPKTDPLSAENPDSKVAFDEEAVAAFEAGKAAQENPVAVDAGLDQDKAVVEGGVAITTAAADDVTVTDAPVVEGTTKSRRSTSTSEGDSK